MLSRMARLSFHLSRTPPLCPWANMLEIRLTGVRLLLEWLDAFANKLSSEKATFHEFCSPG